MVTIISKISKGTNMDQIYLPKNRLSGLEPGTFVVINPVKEQKKEIKPYFYGIESIEPFKMDLIKNIINSISNYDLENIIITGSFLEAGFNFNDIDILIITEKIIDKGEVENQLLKELGILAHIIPMTFKTLLAGINTDPLFQLMMDKYVSTKRVIYKLNQQIDYKLLDLHLLKSKTLPENFDYLSGNEKYGLIRNMFSIEMFMRKEKISNKNLIVMIEKRFGIKEKDIKQNMVPDKLKFITRYKQTYNNLSKKILEEIKNASKQE